MSKPEVLEKNPMNIVEVKQALEKIKGIEEELNFRAQKTEEYGQDCAKIKLKQAKELEKKLVALDIPRLKDVQVHKLIDIMPSTDKHVKIILSSYHMTVSNENAKKIVKAIAEYVPKK